MKCSICGADITNMNHHYVPVVKKNDGKRYCLKCANKERVITLV